jgi:phage gp36-like protein
MAYADASDIIKRYDSRILGNLVADDGETVDEDDLSANAKLTAALAAASGQVNAAILVGERYAADDLTGLTGDSKEFLKTIVCEIAFGMLWRRKPYTDDNAGRKEAVERADEWLKRLRGGEWVFDIDVKKEAGRPTVETVTRVEAQEQNLIVDQVRSHFFPRRRTYRNR